MSRRKRKTVIILSILVVGLSLGFLLRARSTRTHFGDGRARLVITEHSLGAVDPDYDGWSAVLSEDFKTMAYRIKRDGKWFVVVDGEEGRAYNAIWPPERHYGGAVIFSGDGRHLAHTAERDGKWFVVVDGKEGKPFDRVAGNTLTFLSDGPKVAYAAARGEEWFLVNDAVEIGPYERIGSVILSSDGERLAYSSRRGEEWFLVNDAVEIGPYERIGRVVLSSDGERLAYSFQRGEAMYFVCDGKEYGSYDGVYSIKFSPDGRRLLCWVADDAGRKFAVIDGVPVETPADTDVLWPGFAPDGRHIYCQYYRGDDTSLVFDGKEWPAFGYIGEVHFSPDGLHAAYVAEYRESFAWRLGDLLEQVTGWSSIGWNNAWSLVVDGTRGRDYDLILGPVFSPDSLHVGYIAWRDGKCFAVVDGVESLLEADSNWYRQWYQQRLSADGTVLGFLSDRPPEFVLYEIRLVPQ